ncbi:DedA family protein [Bacillus cereus group sp. BfR-BA-01355]|uniref:DedA family protein n=1 Tax=Bacillus cereus group sp. BfR-BA-01355 TaxID=2920318 RepID=UPI001F57B828|nr:DedA family protein [Bacillus cereus group sp. BfR-BA-01355]
MHVNDLLDLIVQYGYPAMFLSLWLGIVGMPIPDEVIVMTGGMVSSLNILHTVPTFILTYLGVVSGLSLGYILGYRIGAPILDRLAKKKKIGSYIQKSTELIHQHGSYALIISYFLPVVRHVVPYLVGINRMNFLRYAMFSYTTGFIWTLGYFTIGYYFGQNIQYIGAIVYKYGLYTLVISGIILLFLVFKKKKNS